MKCCNHSLTTPFCPYCGKAAPAEGLPRLLLHLESTVSSLREKLHNTQQKEPDNAAKLASQQESLDKWLRWRDELDALLKAEDDSVPFEVSPAEAAGI